MGVSPNLLVYISTHMVNPTERVVTLKGSMTDMVYPIEGVDIMATLTRLVYSTKGWIQYGVAYID